MNSILHYRYSIINITLSISHYRYNRKYSHRIQNYRIQITEFLSFLQNIEFFALCSNNIHFISFSHKIQTPRKLIFTQCLFCVLVILQNSHFLGEWVFLFSKPGQTKAMMMMLMRIGKSKSKWNEKKLPGSIHGYFFGNWKKNMWCWLVGCWKKVIGTRDYLWSLSLVLSGN